MPVYAAQCAWAWRPKGQIGIKWINRLSYAANLPKIVYSPTAVPFTVMVLLDVVHMDVRISTCTCAAYLDI